MKCLSNIPKRLSCQVIEDLLNSDLDAVVVATPSALHPQQVIAALNHGLAVFCQKPLARTEAETRSILEKAKAVDRLLGCDLSYRYIDGMSGLRMRFSVEKLARVFHIDLVFHNAYGPDTKHGFMTAVYLVEGALLI